MEKKNPKAKKQQKTHNPPDNTELPVSYTLRACLPTVAQNAYYTYFIKHYFSTTSIVVLKLHEELHKKLHENSGKKALQVTF